MDEYRIELRRVTDARQFCQEMDYKSRTILDPRAEFANLHEFSIYSVTLTAILSDGQFNVTLILDNPEFTTLAAGMSL